MIKPEFFYTNLINNGVNFFTGVPDSLLKSFCAYISDHAGEENHIIAANEGGAVALASGCHLATGKIPLVYMQNSGTGNAANPLLSLADGDVYGIPLILLIGWRGEPAFHDEPQHVKQGKVTCALLEAMGIPFAVMSDDETELEKQMNACYACLKENNSPYALVARKDTFAPYALQKVEQNQGEMSREEAIEEILKGSSPQGIYFSTTGMASRELYEIRERLGQGHGRDFLTVGSMGHASQIALGAALYKPDLVVTCLDGDGAALMHLGSLGIIGSRKPRNFRHIILNNGAHDSVGGQPTVGFKVDFAAI
ncbi:MAG: phosphonopyruvate decarboxylase, partial [Treponema sp.]|nr:phosphonopyruvate decarboxylase [Treponema sp.]